MQTAKYSANFTIRLFLSKPVVILESLKKISCIKAEYKLSRINFKFCRNAIRNDGVVKQKFTYDRGLPYYIIASAILSWFRHIWIHSGSFFRDENFSFFMGYFNLVIACIGVFRLFSDAT